MNAPHPRPGPRSQPSRTVLIQELTQLIRDAMSDWPTTLRLALLLAAIGVIVMAAK